MAPPVSPEQVAPRPKYQDSRDDYDVESTQATAQAFRLMPPKLSALGSAYLQIPRPIALPRLGFSPARRTQNTAGSSGGDTTTSSSSQACVIEQADPRESRDDPDKLDDVSRNRFNSARPDTTRQTFGNTDPSLNQKHHHRIQEINDALLPLLGPENGESCVLLLCSGKPAKCHILPVILPISTVLDTQSEPRWRIIREAWSGSSRGWRRHLPLYGVRKVSIAAEVSLVAHIGSSGPVKNRPDLGHFIGMFTAEDVDSEMQTEKAIRDTDLQMGYPCQYDTDHHKFQHSDECFDAMTSGAEILYTCPFHAARIAARNYIQLSKRALLTWAFEHPEIAKFNDLLPESLFYSRQEILACRNYWLCPSLYEIPFGGLIIEEGWLLSPRSTLLTFMFGGWDAAWGAAGCIVGIATLGYICING
ncbi:hypothetical protein FDECE_6079 [Fusarium decemcellulare]|nr:hypothetical protein FDECE_6079 [Fusarium decemcellulare]